MAAAREQSDRAFSNSHFSKRSSASLWKSTWRDARCSAALAGTKTPEALKKCVEESKRKKALAREVELFPQMHHCPSSLQKPDTYKQNELDCGVRARRMVWNQRLVFPSSPSIELTKH
jgi:hypothetical protein